MRAPHAKQRFLLTQTTLGLHRSGVRLCAAINDSESGELRKLVFELNPNLTFEPNDVCQICVTPIFDCDLCSKCQK